MTKQQIINYIDKNFKPLAIGFIVAMILNVLFDLIENIVLKIALIIAG
jgi:hypothetical protein